jgi:hypothetical protein
MLSNPGKPGSGILYKEKQTKRKYEKHTTTRPRRKG